MTRLEPTRRASLRCIGCLLLFSACDAPATERAPTPSPTSEPATAPIADPEPASEPASEWPEGFPQIPGGTALPASRAGAIHVARAGWSSSPSALESLLRAELERAGWDAAPTTIDEDVIRFAARRGDREIAVSIYADEGRAIVQTMELPFD